jgi:hypothetical protein
MATDPRLRPCGHWDRKPNNYLSLIRSRSAQKMPVHPTENDNQLVDFPRNQHHSSITQRPAKFLVTYYLLSTSHTFELTHPFLCYTVCPTRYRTRLAGGPLLRVATIRRTTDTLQIHSSKFLTQRTYPYSNFVTIFSLVLN